MAKWKDPGERGDFGAWLASQVGERTFDWLAAEMALRGHTHGASYYRGMAGGSKPPGRAIRRALVDYFGGGPAPEEPGDGDPLAAAIQALVGELRLWRTEDRVEIAALKETVADLLRSSRTGAKARVSRS
jgi:hypothetical protein